MSQLKVPYGRRCWAEVDLSQIVRNYRMYRDSMKVPKEVMCVVKANAYGHGDVQVSLPWKRRAAPALRCPTSRRRCAFAPAASGGRS